MIPLPADGEFSAEWLDLIARDRAARPHVPAVRLQGVPFEMDYNQYRALRFRRDRALWRDSPDERFWVELFHSGYLYREPVAIYSVEGRTARLLGYDPSQFRFDPPAEAPPQGSPGDYAGFRLLSRIHSSGIMDEFLVFLGASYFRGIARDQDYGLSARGLAIDTTQPTGEEFPVFRAFWLEKPAPGLDHVTVHALLDSPSITGAFSFRVKLTTDATVMDVDARLFARRLIENAGIAPLTSMYFLGPAGHTRHDDFRERIHDSEGLAVLTSHGERIWRPLINATTLQYSSFDDNNPRGFGLIQRNRNVADYQDLVVRSDIRPSAWVEPVGDWGAGSVVLHEIPTNNEYMDNVVAYWRPTQPLEPSVMRRYQYRLHWCGDVPGEAGDLARVVQTRTGQFIQPPTDRLITIDYRGGGLCESCEGPAQRLHLETAAPSEIGTHAIGNNPIDGGMRVALQFKPNGVNSNDVRAWFERDGQRISETWIYRWVKV